MSTRAPLVDSRIDLMPFLVLSNNFCLAGSSNVASQALLLAALFRESQSIDGIVWTDLDHGNFCIKIEIKYISKLLPGIFLKVS